jgi:hypothetical protein
MAKSLLVGVVLIALLAPRSQAATDRLGCPRPEVSAVAEPVSSFPCVPEGLGPTAAELESAAELEMAPAPASALGDVAYSKDFWNSRFGHHPVEDFASFVTDANGVIGSIYATDFDPTATTLYALDSGSLSWGTIDLITGGFTAIAPSAPTGSGHQLWSGLAIHPVTGTVPSRSTSTYPTVSTPSIRPLASQPWWARIRSSA